MTSPSKPSMKRAFLLWVAVYPLITLLSVLLNPVISALPLLVRTFIITVMIVPFLSFVIMHWLTSLFAGWLKDEPIEKGMTQ